MKLIYLLGAIILTPISGLAHDGEHIVPVWYQDTFTIVSLVIAVIAVSALTYGLLTKQKLFIFVPALVLVTSLVTGISSYNQSTNESEPVLAVADFGAGQSVTLYKSPNCGCCSGHAKALEQAGFTVTIEETDDLDLVKQTHNIPVGGESCHTSVIGDYVVEGHVPLEAIEKLVTEKPEIAGIGLPGMPIGTPGMPGRKTAPYEVYQLSVDGEMSSYVNI
jgi:hypothetical protein